MRVAVTWSGGKDCYTAYHKMIEQGHEVACLLTCVYLKPYIFHSHLISQLGAKALGTPQVEFEVGDYSKMYQNWFDVLARLKKEQGIEALVNGDIDSEDHKLWFDEICGKLGLQLIMPLWDMPPYPGNRYRERILNMELATGMRAIINCIDLKYFGEEWLGREFNRACVEDMKPLVGPPGKGIDAAGEFGDFHTSVLDSPLYRQSIEITKFTKKRSAWGGPGLGQAQTGSGSTTGDFLYMNIEEAVLKQKISRTNS